MFAERTKGRLGTAAVLGAILLASLVGWAVVIVVLVALGDAFRSLSGGG